MMGTECVIIIGMGFEGKQAESNQLQIRELEATIGEKRKEYALKNHSELEELRKEINIRTLGGYIVQGLTSGSYVLGCIGTYISRDWISPVQ